MTEVGESPGETVAASGPARRISLPTWVTTGPAIIWIGVAVAAAGFGLIAIGWGQVAGETQVYLQLPYLVSAGLTGLGLIMVGVTLVNVAARQRDSRERERQIDRLASILEQVEASLAARERQKP